MVNNNTDPIWAIIPASGIGQRMQSIIPKQYLPILGRSVIAHTLDRLFSVTDIVGIVLVLRENDKHWQEIQYQAEKPVHVTIGGAERLNSVMNGLRALLELDQVNKHVLIHDAVRPLVRSIDLINVIQAARLSDAGALLATPITDTIKRQNSDLTVQSTLARNGLWRALTPQVFETEMLFEALKNVIDENLLVTDDASAIELMGKTPKLVSASSDNIKITCADDLLLASQIMLSQQSEGIS